MISALFAIGYVSSVRSPSTSYAGGRSCRVPSPEANVAANLAGVGVLAAVVVVHEWGHFYAARSQGIKVSEFSIGFGPRLLERKGNSDEGPSYSLRALPLGGFVSFPRATNRTKLEELGLIQKGAKIDDFVANTPDLLENRPKREQAIVIAAGVVANIALAWACLFSAGVGLGVPVYTPEPVVVRRVLPASPAEAAGFRPGDTLVRVRDMSLIPEAGPGTGAEQVSSTGAKVRPGGGGSGGGGSGANGGSGKKTDEGMRSSPAVGAGIRSLVAGQPVRTSAGVGVLAGSDTGLETSLRAIRKSIATQTSFSAEVLRGTSPSGAQNVRLGIPTLPRGVKSLGVELSQAPGRPLGRVRLPPPVSAGYAVKAVYRDARNILFTLRGALGSLLPRLPGASAPSRPAGGFQGPLGIAKMGGDIATSDPRRLLEFGAILSLNLAVFNSLPLPGLDGWQMALLIVESARRKELPEGAKEAANAVAGLFFAVAFSRVLFSDVVAAGGGTAIEAVSGFAVQYGPSVAIGLGIGQAVQILGRQGGSNVEGGTSAATASRPGGRRPKRAEQQAKPKKPKPTARRKTSPRPPPRRRGQQADDSNGRWWRG